MYKIKSLKVKGKMNSAILNSQAPICIIGGPNGSGKTTSALCIKHLLLAAKQQPDQDGVRRSIWVILRDTYPNLRDKTIKSFKKHINFSQFETRGSEGRPFDLIIKMEMQDGTTLNTEFWFRALGDDGDLETTVGGLEPTGIGIDEVADLPREAIDFCFGRVGRYPETIYKKDNHGDIIYDDNGEKIMVYGPTYAGVQCAFNKPNTTHWLADYCLKNKPEDVVFFDQASGLISCGANEKGAFSAQGGWWKLNPNAENLENLPPKYYENPFRNNSFKWGKRFVLNQWGADESGQPVYTEYNDEVHGVEVIDTIAGAPLILGADAGRGNPAVVIGQYDAFGKLRILDEYIGKNIGATRFGRGLKSYLQSNYPDCPIECIWVDPAGMAGGHDEEELSWIQILSREVSCRVYPAPLSSNKPDLRIEAVSWGLGQIIDDFKPMMIISHKAKALRGGFLGEYKFGKQKVGGDIVLTPSPMKNDASHPHDALQYLCLGLGFLDKVLGRRKSLKTVVAKGKSYGR